MKKIVSPLIVTLIASAPLCAETRRDTAFRSLHHVSGEVLSITEGPGTWYGMRNGFQNQGVAACKLREIMAAAPAGREPWEHKTQGVIWGTPVVDRAGNVYVGSADKVFYALTPQGQVRWTYTLPDAADAVIDSAATLTPDGLVVVPGGDGQLHALRQSDGALMWRFRAHGADHESGVTVNSFEGNCTLAPDGNLYAGCDNGTMYALDRNGKERWSFKTGMMIWSSVAFDPAGKWMCFGSLDRKLYVLEQATGKLIASYKAGAEFKGGPSVGPDGRIFVGNSDFSFRCLELGTSVFGGTVLKEKWAYQAGGEIYATPALAGDRVVFGSHDGFVYCLGLDGKLIWKYGIYARVSASALVTQDGVVVVGAKNGKLYALDLESGQRLWSFKTAPGLYKVNLDASPAITPDGRLVVGSYDGRIVGLPAEFAGRHPADPRVSLAPGHDQPEFGGDVPATGGTLRFFDAAGALPASPAQPIAPTALLTYKLIAREGAELVANAALAALGVEVTMDPPCGADALVATDGSALTLIPKGFWKPGVTYTAKIRARWFRRGNPFVDLLKWWNLPKFEATTRFTVQPASGAMPEPEAGAGLRYSIRNLYLAQPELLDTLIPAAMDGQAFVSSVVEVERPSGRLAMLVLPAYPRPNEVVVRAAPEKVFTLHGVADGGHIRVEGPVAMAAMGGSMALEPLRFFGFLGPDGLQDGQLQAQAPLFKIKGNGTMYTALSWTAMDDISDPYLRLQAVGTASGGRLPALKPGITVAQVEWVDRKTVRVRVELASPVVGDHLITGLAFDRAKFRIQSHSSVKLANAAAGHMTFTLSVPQPATPDDFRLYFDGEPLSQGVK